MIILTLIMTGLVCFALTPLLAGLYDEQRKENFRNEMVPVGLGLGIVIVTLVAWLIHIQLAQVSDSEVSRSMLFALTAVAFALIGMVDDNLGNRAQKGFSGHFGALKVMQLTTGSFKAIVGLIVAIGLSMQFSEGFWGTISGALIIVLSANLLNLFDLRPGRASKFFIIIGSLLLITRLVATNLLLMMAAIIGYLPWDLRGKVMMGDTGSNAIGAVLGLAIAMSHVTFFPVVSLIILLVLNISAETISFSEIIASNRFLNYLDKWGSED